MNTFLTKVKFSLLPVLVSLSLCAIVFLSLDYDSTKELFYIGASVATVVFCIRILPLIFRDVDALASLDPASLAVNAKKDATYIKEKLCWVPVLTTAATLFVLAIIPNSVAVILSSDHSAVIAVVTGMFYCILCSLTVSGWITTLTLVAWVGFLKRLRNTVMKSHGIA